MTQHNGRTLVMTVGTGDIDRIEDTLLKPLRKSIATDEWDAVVLLPSTVTESFARQLRQGIDVVDVDIHPLPPGDENDADRAYAHFDQVLATLLENAAATEIEVDFTRGTKAMSAALVLAATRRAIPHLRYLVGPRDRRGMVEAGAEQVRRIRTTIVDGHRRLDFARALMRRGNFAAVADVLPDPHHSDAALYPDVLVVATRAVHAAARFYAAWDRFDYARAADVDVGTAPSGEWGSVWPSDEMRTWLRSLQRAPERSDHPAMAAWLRRLVVDVLANGERRVRDGQHEDALLRGYRTLELVGQVRLFDHGLDSGNLDPNHQAVKALQRSLAKKNGAPLTPAPGGELQAARFQVARILKRCGDALAERLLELDNTPLLKPALRNTSVLVHGFVSRAPDDPEPLHRLFNDLETLVREDGGADVAERLRIARSPDFRAGGPSLTRLSRF